MFSHGVPAHESHGVLGNAVAALKPPARGNVRFESTVAGETAAGHHAPLGHGGRGPPDLKNGEKKERD